VVGGTCPGAQQIHGWMGKGPGSLR
jgi:hypothetical protein